MVLPNIMDNKYVHDSISYKKKTFKEIKKKITKTKKKKEKSCHESFYGFIKNIWHITKFKIYSKNFIIINLPTYVLYKRISKSLREMKREKKKTCFWILGEEVYNFRLKGKY